jgi:dihydrofolate synthase/folylpolyglutamate synthase
MRQPRADETQRISKRLPSRSSKPDEQCGAGTVAEAIDKAVKDSVRPLSEDTIGILITGSVVTVGEARGIVRKKLAKEVK